MDLIESASLYYYFQVVGLELGSNPVHLTGRDEAHLTLSKNVRDFLKREEFYKILMDFPWGQSYFARGIRHLWE